MGNFLQLQLEGQTKDEKHRRNILRNSFEFIELLLRIDTSWP